MGTILLTSPFDLMPIGKYKGIQIQDIIEHDTDYAEWMLSSMKSVQFSKEIKESYNNWKLISQ